MLHRLPSLWAGLSAATALLAATSNVIALVMPERIYGLETPVLFDAGIAQDLVSMFVVAPLTLVLVLAAVRGSRRSWFSLLGVLAFTAYNYAI